MIAYLRGKFIDKSPTQIIVEAGPIAYFVSISLHTFTQIGENKEGLIYTHLIVKEDSHTLFGFHTEEERTLFISLISVNGVGPNTARLVLSSLEPSTVRQAIVNGDDGLFRKVKGVGPKTALRIIIDLRDKMSKDMLSIAPSKILDGSYKRRSESISALEALGFGKPQIEQALKSIPEAQFADIPVEEIIKIALKKLA